MRILGAGLAGCLAGMLNQRFTICEPKRYDEMNKHKAVLRFRSPDIGEAIGIPFEKIEVYKGIWHNDKSVELAPRYINLYSRKVSDKVMARSITNIETTTRWVAPDDIHDILLDILNNRIDYGCEIDDLYSGDDIKISTLPLFVTAKKLGYDFSVVNNNKKINVSRFRIPDCDIYQTYYYTDPTVHMYRATITKDILIIESCWEVEEHDITVAKRSFGLHGVLLETLVHNYEQSNGKISPIDDRNRRELLYNLTTDHNIYSLGRFATWKNVVLDDVYHDILTIKKFMLHDKYEARRINNEGI